MYIFLIFAFFLTISKYDLLSITGNYFYSQNGQQFSAIDADNDSSSERDCAEERGGGWWYNACGSGLNGNYVSEDEDPGTGGIRWQKLEHGTRYSFKTSVMKIRRN